MNPPKKRLSEVASYLMMALGLVLPLSVAASYFILLLILLIWILRNDFRNDWIQLKNNPVALSVIAFFLIHIIGLLWTSDIKNGIYVLKKESLLLLLPLLMLFAKKEHINLYINTFLVAMTASVILSLGIWLNAIPPVFGIDPENPTPFMTHISYNPYLTITIYLVLYRLFIEPDQRLTARFLYTALAFMMTFNMFITIGRAGQIMFFAMIGIVFFQFFHKQTLKAVIFSILSITFVFLLSYNTSEVFRYRVNKAADEIRMYNENKETNVGLRIAFSANSFEIIRKHPFIGVGTGDFSIEYEKINAQNTPELPAPSQPHNMYVLTLVQFGVFGLLSLTAILYSQIRQAMKSGNHLQKHLGITLPLLFALIMLSDSYLRGHFTTMLFVYLSSFLYSDYKT